jgi:cell wall-associated NlpC family hydrolase
MRVVLEALSWLGTPYHHCADLKGQGVDCAMILVRVFNKAGLIPNIDPRPYSPMWHLHRSEEKYLSWLDDYATTAPKDYAPRPGDVLAWKVGRTYSHAGIVVTDQTFLHALVNVGVIETNLLGNEWAERPRLTYVLKGID